MELYFDVWVDMLFNTITIIITENELFKLRMRIKGDFNYDLQRLLN